MVETLWPEEKGFNLHRENIGKQYIFIHVLTPITAILKGKEVEVLPGGCIFFGMDSMQHFSSEKNALLHDWFHADSKCSDLMKKYGLVCEVVYYPEANEEITRLLIEIEIEYINKEQYYYDAATSIAEKIFIKISRAGETPAMQTPIDTYQKELFINARSKIHMNIRHQWTAEEMASLVNLSPSRFYFLYKKMFGISPQQDLIRKRVLRAKILLSKKQLTVTQVAEMTGYANPYHFIRQFRKYTGITPGKVNL